MDIFRLLIDGELVNGDATMDVVNPANEQVLAQAPRASVAQLERAVAAAKRAFPAWAAKPIAERRKAMSAIADRIEEHHEELARLLTQEQGKPIGSASGELTWLARNFRKFGGMDLPIEVLKETAERRIEAHRRPLGVVAAIVPWNFPLGMLGWKLPFALLAGNTLIVKPAPTTPLATLRVGELIRDLLPPGVINIITDLNDLGTAISSHTDIRKIAFTGSTATGRKIMASAAPTLKRLSLELGGNDAAVVLDDVDPKVAAPKLFDSAFGNTGQVCIAMKRLYVHESIYDEICDELVALAEQAVVGDGLDQGTKYGPIQNRTQYEKVKVILADARLHGTVIAGGDTMGGPGYFMPPTIVRDIAEGARLVDEEQFGPLLPVIKFADEDDAMTRANASSHGLGGSIWSSRPERAYQLALRMDAGTIWVNQHGKLDEDVPFGGSKQSGFGVEMGREGLNEFTQLTVISIAL